MKIPEQVLLKALREKKILPYEKELIEKLRTIYYCGFPLSIVLLSKDMCRRNCYIMSMNLSRAMKHFVLVHGDVNFIVKNNQYPNHSWVEKDGFVYDTTDGFKWEKDLYYSLFQPEVREVYDERSVRDYEQYQTVLRRAYDKIDFNSLKLMIQYLELLEIEKPYVNKEYLQQEIDIWREENNVSKFPDKVMDEYKRRLTKLKTDNNK